MAIQNSSGQASSNRVDIIQAVRTPLGFFSLVVLVVEVILGVTANFSQGIDRTYLIVGMLILIFFLVIIVAAFAFFRPEALSGERADDSTAASLISGVETFDRLSDEIETTITNQQPLWPHRFMIKRVKKGVVAYQLMQNFSDDHFNQLSPDVKRRIQMYETSLKIFEKEWESIKQKDATYQLNPQVRDKQLDLIKGMKENLVGVVDVLQVAGFYLDDHYITVRDLLLKLASSESPPSGGKV